MYQNEATKELSYKHPNVASEDKSYGIPGYAVRVGEWKGVVPHCGDGEEATPSAVDLQVMEVYHLPTDPFEQHNLATTVRVY
eukprot:SAG31_NODE_581_length_13927_cov_78.549899_16_plen_82_part_00